MKFDMHCHTKEGSMDGKVMIEEYIRTLKRKGFGGMLVSDHDSYDGYREWKNAIKGRAHQDFVVLKGVEYDTCDCGHILVIMPFGVKLKILELRGLPGSILVKIVHAYGGILGPAHPYGEKFMSMISTNERKKKYQQRIAQLLPQFPLYVIDFVVELQNVFGGGDFRMEGDHHPAGAVIVHNQVVNADDGRMGQDQLPDSGDKLVGRRCAQQGIDGFLGGTVAGPENKAGHQNTAPAVNHHMEELPHQGGRQDGGGGDAVA